MSQTLSVRAKRRDAEENREAILAAASAALNQDPDASIETIAATAGLSRRAIYGHFATRDDLLAELLSRGAARVSATVVPISHDDPFVEIALFGATLWAAVEHIRVMAQLAVRGPYRERVALALRPARDTLLRTVERGIADGSLRQDIDASTLARLIEGAALAVLDEATRTDLPASEGHRLVMLNGLSAAGLGWREAEAVIAGHAELRYRDDDAERASAQHASAEHASAEHAELHYKEGDQR